jgi:hypothetical protein
MKFDAWLIWRWISPRWWHYLFEDCTGWRNFWCRVRGHPRGPLYYNVGGSEPDWRCRDCNEFIG